MEFEQNQHTKLLVGKQLTPISFVQSFDSMGGSMVTLQQNYNVGDTYDSLPATTYAAHKFAGWKNRFGNIVADGDFVDYYSPVLSAKWLNPTNITWDAATNGGTTGSTTDMYWYIGEPFGVLPDATHSTLAFAGWYTAATGGTKVGTNDIFSGSQTTFYAQFTSYNDPIGNIICPTQNITFTNSDSYPWSFDDTTGVNAYKCCQDIYTNNNNYSVLQGTFTGSGTLTFDVYCNTESHYDGMYVIIDDNSFYMKWTNVFDWSGEYGDSGAVNVDNCWVFSGIIGWSYNCQLTVSSDGQHNVYFVFGNDCNDGNGSGEYFSKSTVLVKNVRFE